MLIVGEKEAKQNKISVRQQGKGDIGTYSVDEFSKIINDNINESLQNFNNLS
jgi:threonyl-tRNA synthetase